MIKYRINWQSKETLAIGHGQPIFNSVEMAQATADKLNEEAPYLVHYVEAVAVDDTAKEQPME